MQQFSHLGRFFKVKTVACAFNHDNIRILDIRQALIVKLLVIDNFPLEGPFAIEEECWSFESAFILKAVDVFLVLVDGS